MTSNWKAKSSNTFVVENRSQFKSIFLEDKCRDIAKALWRYSLVIMEETMERIMHISLSINLVLGVKSGKDTPGESRVQFKDPSIHLSKC